MMTKNANAIADFYKSLTPAQQRALLTALVAAPPYAVMNAYHSKDKTPEGRIAAGLVGLGEGAFTGAAASALATVLLDKRNKG